MNGLIKALHNHKNNIFSWKTKRKIVVIESDDWGSIRMSGKTEFQNLLKAGVAVDKSHYNIFDGLERNADLEGLYEVLRRHKDKTGRHPVITGANIVANPHFDKIKEADYKEYFVEPVTDTYQRYGENHNRVAQLYKEGIKERLFVPAFHGREHLSVSRWLTALQNGNKQVIQGFENQVTGMPCGFDLQAAFAVDRTSDIPKHQEIIREGLNLFSDIFGFRTKYFIPPNGPFNASSYAFLKEQGISFLNSRKRMILPDEHGNLVKDFRYCGMKNKFGQYYFVRNCFFEPSSSDSINHIDDCLSQIKTAFLWRNPAIISTHRVNYIGWLVQENRDKGLSQLNELLTKIIKSWPDVEFLTTEELGELIRSGTDR
jgi:predicted deacetylase